MPDLSGQNREPTLAEKQQQERMELAEQLKSQHGLKRVFIIRIQRTDTDELKDTDPEKYTYWYVRGPKPIEAIRFNNEAVNEEKRNKALNNITWPCLLHPTGQELEELKTELPLAFMTIGNRLLEIAGLVKENEIKKV